VKLSGIIFLVKKIINNYLWEGIEAGGPKISQIFFSDQFEASSHNSMGQGD
jgi:hypothetical protein